MPRREQPSAAVVAGGFVVSAFANTLTQSLLQPASRSLGYVANFAARDVCPDPSAIIQLYHSGKLQTGPLFNLMGMQGVEMNLDANYDQLSNRSKAWYDLVEVSRPSIGFDYLVDLVHRGRLEGDVANAEGRRLGLSDAQIAMRLGDFQAFPLEIAINLRNRGVIDTDTLKSLVLQNGYFLAQQGRQIAQLKQSIGVERSVAAHWIGSEAPDGVLNQISYAGYGSNEEMEWLKDAPLPFQPPDAMNMWFRGYLTQEQSQQHLRATQTRSGLNTEEYQLSLRPMPGPSDLVRFAVKEVWDAGVVQRWGYDDEFPVEFQVFMERQGMGWGDHPADFPGAPFVGITWPKAYWRAHWQPMPVFQAHQAYHMLRPDRIARYRPEVPDIQPFTYDHLRDVLKVADYPPAMRNWLAANAFSPLRLTDIRQAYLNEIINKDEVRELMRDRGHTLADANVAADLLEKKKFQQDTKPGLDLAKASVKENLRHILDSYDVGLIPANEAYRLLVLAFVPENTVRTILQNVDTRREFRRLKLYTKKVKKGFMEGTYSSLQVSQFLQLLGIIPARIIETLSEWDLERTVSHKAATSAMILKYVREGLLTPVDGRARLANLGWVNVDAALAVASAQAALARTQTRALAAADRERERRARLLQAAQEDAQKERKKIAADLRRTTPISTLKTWYVNCRIHKKYLVPRLRAMLYTEDDIRRYLIDWDKIREEKGHECQDESPEKNGEASAPPSAGE